jgi:hypothetical protein
MTKLWYQDFRVLLDEPFQFFPSNNLNDTEKINSLARLAIYYSIIIIITGRSHSYLTISLVIIIISFLLGRTEPFNNNIEKPKCYKPTDANPFMNFTINDYYKDPNRPENCPIDQVRQDMRKKFLKRIVPDPTDLWGQNFSDRNFYTTPSTRIVNDQTGFANWCYGEMGQCKTYGKGCLKRALSRTGTGMFGSPI